MTSKISRISTQFTFSNYLYATSTINENNTYKNDYYMFNFKVKFKFS